MPAHKDKECNCVQSMKLPTTNYILVMSESSTAHNAQNTHEHFSAKLALRYAAGPCCANA